MSMTPEDWNRRVAASREIHAEPAYLELAYDDPIPAWLEPEQPWSWPAIATLLAALAAGGAAVWWFAA